MEDDLFDRLRQDAKNRELQVRAAATVASAAATYMVKRIEAASSGADKDFIRLMEPYWRDFQTYAGLRDELDRRCSERCKMRPHATTENLYNVKMFGAVADELGDPNFQVRTSALVPALETRKSSRPDKLHTALHLLELAAAFNYDTHPVGHMIGPVIGLVLGVFERRARGEARDAFSDTSRFLTQLKDVDRHLRSIAVGVHRVPDFWPKMGDVATQRQRRNLPNAKHLSAASPLSVEEAERAVSDALNKHSQKELSAPAQ